MGCTPSKEITTVKTPWKRAYNRIVSKEAKHRRITQVRSSTDALGYPQVPSDPKLDNVKTLATVLHEEEVQPEVINVMELMQGLEDEPDESESKCWADTEKESKADDEEENSSISSPDMTGLHLTPSPRSPLCFGVEYSQHTNKRKKTHFDLDVVVARNFSFNVRSSPFVDQASTPKVILESTLPPEDFKQRLTTEDHKPDSQNIPWNGDAELLEAIETMIDQISRVSNTEADEYECTTTFLKVQSEEVPALIMNARYVNFGEQVEKRDELLPHVQCSGCSDACFVPCLDCNGSQKFVSENGVEDCTGCIDGMVKCPLCSSC